MPQEQDVHSRVCGCVCVCLCDVWCATTRSRPCHALTALDRTCIPFSTFWCMRLYAVGKHTWTFSGLGQMPQEQDVHSRVCGCVCVCLCDVWCATTRSRPCHALTALDRTCIPFSTFWCMRLYAVGKHTWTVTGLGQISQEQDVHTEKVYIEMLCVCVCVCVSVTHPHLSHACTPRVRRLAARGSHPNEQLTMSKHVTTLRIMKYRLSVRRHNQDIHGKHMVHDKCQSHQHRS